MQSLDAGHTEPRQQIGDSRSPPLAAQRKSARERLPPRRREIQSRVRSQPGAQRFERRVAVVRVAPRQELISEAREAVDVVARMRLTTGASIFCEDGLRARLDARQEARKLDLVGFRDEHVIQPQIAVDDALRMRVVQRIAHVTQDAEHLVLFERVRSARIEHDAQRRALEQLFAEKILGAVTAELEHFGDVRVRPGLRVQPQLLETFDESGLLGDPRGQTLESNMVLDADQRFGQRAVERFEDGAIAALSQSLLKNEAAGDDVADLPLAGRTVADGRGGSARLRSAGLLSGRLRDDWERIRVVVPDRGSDARTLSSRCLSAG